MPTICSLWSSENSTWKDANWLWPECKHVPEPITIGNPPGVDASLIIPQFIDQPWDAYKQLKEKKKKRIINLICKVKGQQYSVDKEAKTVQVDVDDVSMVVNSANKNIDVDLKVE